MNELLAALLGLGGGGAGNYSAPSGTYGPMPEGGPALGGGFGTNPYPAQVPPGRRILQRPGEPSPAARPQLAGDNKGGAPAALGQFPVGSGTVSEPGQMPPGWGGYEPPLAKIPPTVGSDAWRATHPNYQPSASIGGLGGPPTVGSDAWRATHPNYQPPASIGGLGPGGMDAARRRGLRM